jgi:UDP-3-O-[3-hydroxymyristoyl] N-acetylglucosamine deacetylase
MGIDNAVVEINNLEAPILDGSGWPFVELLEQAGRRQLRRKRRYVRIRRPVEVRDGPKRLTILPAESLRVTCATDFGHPLAGPQEIDFDITPHTYAREIARARTFGFERDLDQMRDMGLIRGASLSNAICFTRHGILNPEGLRFADECCRHKVLDLIGDLALIGRPLVGHVIAERAGHAMHATLLAQIMNDRSTYDLVTLDQLATEAAQALVG